MILDLIALDNSSKVWVYQSKTELSDEQIAEIKEDLSQFLERWTSHNKMLYTYGNIFHKRFLAIFVDERFAGPVDALLTSQFILFNILRKNMTFHFLIEPM